MPQMLNGLELNANVNCVPFNFDAFGLGEQIQSEREPDEQNQLPPKQPLTPLSLSQ